eukprot:TRINITY_DN56057_c0_g2_i2.p1 TRINITY_DN56057_c0_g2~~TRINITY_DN56057_c0_g2_i2.p1  ORF type:complete len:652 (-),score=20.80 TRINITY_DN56057_c0_g2_i2:97-2052(-)
MQNRSSAKVTWTLHTTASLRGADPRRWSQLDGRTGEAPIPIGAGSCVSGDEGLLHEIASPQKTTVDPWPSAKEGRRRQLLFSRKPEVSWKTSLTLGLCGMCVAPFMLERQCDYDVLVRRNPNYISSLLAVLLVLTYPKVCLRKSDASLWVQRYIRSFVIHAGVMYTWEWIMVFCAAPAWQLSALVAAKDYSVHATYMICQLCLAWLSALRLRWMAYVREAAQALLIIKLAIGFGMVGFLIANVSRRFHVRHGLPLGRALQSVAILLYIAFQVRVFSAFLRAGCSALAEARRSDQSSAQPVAALFTASAVALASGSTVAMGLDLVMGHRLSPWIYHTVLFIDLSTDVTLAIVCSGIVTPAADQERNFQIAGELIVAARRREVLRVLKDAARAVTGPSVAVAALFEGKDPEELLQSAVERFRCISWETLRQHPHLVKSGGAVEGVGLASNLYKYSEPCKLSECDAFFSHSWHDDPLEKWEALTNWCTDFCNTHGRAPRLWFDKVCIDQTNIQTDLQCLPIFIAGCNNLLVSCGRTYTTRLWCCVELFVFMKMSEGVDRHIHVIRTGNDDGTADQVTEAWTNFDVQECRCFKADDKTRILECIEKDGGVEVFNAYIRSLASDMFQEPSPRQERQHDATVAAESTAHVADDGASI